MKFSAAITLLVIALASTDAAFVPGLSSRTSRGAVVLRGYLDDLSKELYAPSNDPDIEATSKEATDAKEGEKDRFGPGEWDKYVDFDEFDGGDGQMGVAGDGNSKLEKFGRDVQPQLAKSKAMSAKNAWGTATGYADSLIDKGVEYVRAQQFENWRNQQEIKAKKDAQKVLTDESFDQVTAEEEDWRSLSKFGVERNEEFDLDEAFGPVTPGDEIEGVIELSSRIGVIRTHELPIKNEYMGFADFRAAFTADTPMDWTILPNEGSMSSKEPTEFVIKFKPQNPGVVEGHLVIETEDFKKSWKVIGTTA